MVNLCRKNMHELALLPNKFPDVADLVNFGDNFETPSRGRACDGLGSRKV